MTPPSPRRSPAAILMTCAVPVAAMLSFAVQPMMGKRLLPIYGGSAGTWLGTMVYFQMALLLGYGWATWLLTRPLRFQRRATLALAGLALLTFRLPGLDSAAGGILRIIWVLGLHSMPAIMLLFSVSPLMHGWLRRRGEPVPYYLYAISNLGSLIGLVSYPFLIEPAIGLGAQRWIIHAGIALLTALIGGAVALGRDGLGNGSSEIGAGDSAATAEAAATASQDGEVTPLLTQLSWVGMSLLTCVCMLGATDLLAAELGSSPLVWVGPFGAYLLSFTIVFSGRWRDGMTTAATLSLIVGLTGFMFCKGPTSVPLAGAGFYFLILVVASACLIGNALLYRLRPAVRFDRFYLALGVGGVAGGLLLSFVLPYVFALPVEFILSSALLLLGAVAVLVARREPKAQLLAALLTVVPLAGLWLRMLVLDGLNMEIQHMRNEYGHMLVRTSSTNGQSRVELVSASTVHGTQLHVDQVSARRPTQYYTESGGAGRTILQLGRGRPAMRIGVIGLGSGTLAAYGRQGDEMRFWDIDPKVIQIANSTFTYLKDSAAKVEVIAADGRRGLAASTDDYDVIVVDAFSGDSVPPHLVTVEALRTYFARLEVRKGTLVIHVSGRYGHPFPVLLNTALAAGRQAIGVTTHIAAAGANADWDPSDTEYVIVPPADLKAAFKSVYPETEDSGRVTRTFSVPPASSPEPSLIWTDDRHAAIDMIDLRVFLNWKTL